MMQTQLSDAPPLVDCFFFSGIWLTFSSLEYLSKGAEQIDDYDDNSSYCGRGRVFLSMNQCAEVAIFLYYRLPV